MDIPGFDPDGLDAVFTVIVVMSMNPMAMMGAMVRPVMPVVVVRPLVPVTRSAMDPFAVMFP